MSGVEIYFVIKNRIMYITLGGIENISINYKRMNINN